MTNLNGGYVMVDLASTKVYEDAKAAVAAKKPILVYDNGKCYYADTFEVDGDSNVVITKGGKTITIEPDGDVVSVGSIENPLMDNIKDKDGRLRFIEGDAVFDTISGVNFLYGKWSLSGTHLMFVLAGTINDTTTIPDGRIATFNIPEWVGQKIFGVWGQNIQAKSVDVYNADWSTQTIKINLKKDSDTKILIANVGNFTATKERNFRFQYDLLIDQE